MNITLFGAENEVSDGYKQPAAELARLIAKNGHTLVWGGVYAGLMKIMTDVVQQNGGKIIGIGADYLKEKLHKNADEMLMASGMDERNRIMLEKGDAICALPGGIGTVNEVTYVLRLTKQGFNKPIAVLNTDNFFEGLKIQLERMQKERFLKKPYNESICFADTPEAAIEYINTHGN